MGTGEVFGECTPTRNVQSWLGNNPQVHFHFTPTGSSWLNLVDNNAK